MYRLFPPACWVLRRRDGTHVDGLPQTHSPVQTRKPRLKPFPSKSLVVQSSGVLRKPEYRRRLANTPLPHPHNQRTKISFITPRGLTDPPDSDLNSRS